MRHAKNPATQICSTTICVVEISGRPRTKTGNNMAITAELYLACGGMPRRPSPTDRTFLNRVRRTTDAIEHRRDMVVENSTRRLRAYGLLGAALWYLDRGSGRLTPDPR